MTKIMFMGDSVTDWYRSGDGDNALGSGYPLLVASELAYNYPAKYEFVNKGISGNRSIDILGRVQGDVVQLKPDYISILVGVNDVWHGVDYNCGITPEKYEIYYNMMIDEIKQGLPDIKIMIMEPFILDGKAVNGDLIGLDGTAAKDRYERFHAKMDEIANIAKRIALKHDLPFIPLQSLFNEALKKAPVEYWSSDGVHPTYAGHQIIKNAWIETFENLLDEKINTSTPATMLKNHPDVTLICDEGAYYEGVRAGIDIGGTNIKFAVVKDEKVEESYSLNTPRVACDIVSLVETECLKLTNKYNIKSFGIGIPGEVKDGLVYTDNLPFDGFPFEEVLKKNIDVPIRIENDANCAAIGEMHYSNEKYDNAVLITIGTGIGGGIIVNGKLCSHMGEIGHFIYCCQNGLPCNCGLSGCWEQYASTTALIRMLTETHQKNNDTILDKLYKENNCSFNGKSLFEAMKMGSPLANEVFDRYLTNLADGIDSINKIFAPEVIILAGGITKQNEVLLEPLKVKIRTKVNLKISNLQETAGVLGAAML